MSQEQIEAKRDYDSKFQKTRVSDKVERNKGRKKLGLKPGDPRDASEVMVNGKKMWRRKDKSKNRGATNDMPGDKRARGKGSKRKKYKRA